MSVKWLGLKPCIFLLLSLVCIHGSQLIDWIRLKTVCSHMPCLSTVVFRILNECEVGMKSIYLRATKVQCELICVIYKKNIKWRSLTGRYTLKKIMPFNRILFQVLLTFFKITTVYVNEPLFCACPAGKRTSSQSGVDVAKLSANTNPSLHAYRTLKSSGAIGKPQPAVKNQDGEFKAPLHYL